MQDYSTTLELYYIVITFLSKVIGFYYQQKLLVLFYASANKIIITGVL